MHFRTRLAFESLDGRIVPSTVPLSNQPEHSSTASHSAANAAAAHSVIGSLDINWQNGTGTYSGCVDTTDLLTILVDYSYTVNGIVKDGSFSITVNSDGSYSGSFILPAGMTQENSTIEIAAYYNNGNGPLIRVLTEAP